jgi:hypothetical protein
VYGDDRLQGRNLPTAVFMTARIVEDLGYMAPPDQRHLYLDDGWKQWGERAGCLQYLPEVVIEHMHPGAGKAAHDALYAETGSHAQYQADRVAYEAYLNDGRMDADVAKIRGLR